MQAAINMEIDLSELFPEWTKDKIGTMYAGFTASTGRLYESHAISDWTFYEVDAKHRRTVQR